MSGLQEGRLGGEPAVAAFCAPCKKGIAVAAWQDESEPFAAVMVRTARYVTGGLDTIHRLEIVSDTLVTVPQLVELGNTFAYCQQQATQFLRAWCALHESCQPDSAGVDQS